MNPIPTVRRLLVLLWLHFAAGPSTRAAVIPVTTTLDRLPTNAVDLVPGTLRGAILLANRNPDRDIIAFLPSLLSAPTPGRIRLVAPLPYLLHPVVLDATPLTLSSLDRTNMLTDPLAPAPTPSHAFGYQPPALEITPADGPMMDDGLRLTDNSVVRGVALFGFLRQLAVTGRSNLVESCYAGCSSAGEPGAPHPDAVGIAVSGEFNRVTHCTVSGNGSHGIVLEFASNCEVLDNLIGPLSNGEVLGNLGTGITVDNARTNIIGRAPFRGNIITGNVRGGIALGFRFPDFSTRGTVIEANDLGPSLDLAMDAEEGPRGNGSHGILIYQQRQIVVRGNRIQGSHGDGVHVSGSSAVENRIEANFIGTRASGSGVHVFLGTRNVITGNEIEGNLANGVHLHSASVNQVTNNTLRFNGQAGVYLQGPDNAFSQAADNLVLDNLATGNGGPGIVQHGNARQNRFIGNAILDNGGLGIDLGGTNEAQVVVSPIYDAPFTNSFSRGDGPNVLSSDILQPYRQGVALTAVTLSNSVVRVGGHFRTPPEEPLIAGGLYLLHFFASSVGDISGFGEGENLVGSFLVGPIPSFNASTNFLAVFTNAAVLEGDLITATLTRTNNSSTANQTSEFSNVLPARPRGPITVGDRVTTPEDQPVEFAVKDNDFDPEGGPVTVESVSIDAPGLGFGTILGSATLLPNQTVRFVPAANLHSAAIPGPVRIRYVVRDQGGLKAGGVAEVTIVPVNDPPQAYPDLAETRTDTPVSIAVRKNDTDVDGDPLSITTTTPPGHGTVSNDAGKAITYTPQPGYVGTDVFGYEISDGHGGVANTTVTVLVRNTAAATDLAVTQVRTAGAISPGIPATFFLYVANLGPIDAPGVVLEIRLPAQARVVATGSSQGSSTREGSWIRFNLGLIPAGSGVDATVQAAADSPGVLSCNARVLSLVGDSNPGNDHATTTVSVVDGREPELHTVQVGDHLRLEWDASAGSFEPEYRRGVGRGAPWRHLAAPPVRSGDRYQVDLPDATLSEEGFMLFRLTRR